MLTNMADIVDDMSLWEKFLSGDDKAYTCIYKKYVKELFSYGVRFTPDRELVKDCIQDVFVKIYSNRLHLNRTDNVRLYLFVALKNTLFNVFQKDEHSYHDDTAEPVFSVEYSIEDQLIENEDEQERADKINLILNMLTPRQREVIYYRYVEGMRMDEICVVMKMNYQSVQNLIQRSIKKVRTAFKEKDQCALSIKYVSRCL
jgi:RNA polymerase sigma factor (sigma-70 family)